MASDINACTVVGRLTRDSELGYSTSGSALLKFSIASNRGVKRGDQWTEEASFFDITVWGKRAESLANYLHKGKQVAVSGELIQDRWQAKDGTNRSKVYINAQNIQMLGGGPDRVAQPGSYDKSKAPQTMGGAPPQNFEDDIPF